MSDVLTLTFIIVGFVFVILFVFMCIIGISTIINKYILSSAKEEKIGITETKKNPIYRHF